MNLSIPGTHKRNPITIQRIDTSPLDGKDYPRYNDNYLYQQDRLFKNSFDFAVIIRHRNGLSVTVPPVDRILDESRSFDIFERLRKDTGVKFNAGPVLDEADGILNPLDAIRESMALTASNTSYHAFDEAVLKYSLSLELFEKNSYGVYINELDLCISRADSHYTYLHPYSEEGLALAERIVGSHSSLEFRIEIVDSKRQLGDRWVNINGMVYHISAMSDTTRQDAVYIIARCGVHKSQLTSYALDEADEKLNLFRTRQEAIELGQSREVAERQHQALMANLKREADEAQANFVREKQEMEQETLRLKQQLDKTKLNTTSSEEIFKQQLAALQHREAQFEIERTREQARMKDYYELRSHERKDSSEMIKWLPTAIVALAAIWLK